MRRSLIMLAAVSAIWSAPAVLAEGLPELGEASQADFSPQMEKKVGESIMQEIRLKEPSYLDDPEVESYLNRLGHRLSANIEGPHPDFEFFALRDNTLNAFAMPGGYIGVHSALIQATQSESELASVLSHEISHVTQHHIARGVSQQSQSYMTTLISLAAAILASRHGGGDVAQGALIAGQAAGVQQQLGYSRDFEREADRLGIQLLERSGYDVRGMAAFFERLQRSSRLYENNAPGYLRTHPLTTERISDMENRIQAMPYHQVADSLDFQLVRSKLRAQDGAPQDAVVDFETQLKERKFSSETAARYGLAEALLRTKNYAGAEAQLAELRRLKAASPMIETLAADLRMKQDDPAAAAKLLRAAAVRYPTERAVSYALVESLLAAGQPQEALKVTIADLQAYTTDYRMHGLQAKTYAALGKHLQQHRAQGEAYFLQGQLMPAIEQFDLAQKADDGDFYEHSQVDARLRALKRRQAEEAKQKKQQ
jgi:predicted Zn-dependent protease